MSFLKSLIKVTCSDGPIEYSSNPWLSKNIVSLTMRAPSGDEGPVQGTALMYWRVSWELSIYHMHQGSSIVTDDEDDGDAPTYREWSLPNSDFDGAWESLYYDTDIKPRLLRYATSSLQFSDAGVDPCSISWNRTLLLHGPPGTGKTTLCKALAHELAILLCNRYPRAKFLEVNAHNLFSKWFSESGKLVSRLFDNIMESVRDARTLVFILIDEVESLTAARAAAIAGNEPSDAIRSVNSLLTSLDKMKNHPNFLILTTSNITEAIDAAFIDRADFKAYIGPPALVARYHIFSSALSALKRADIISDAFTISTYKGSLMPENDLVSQQLLKAAVDTDGFSGRTLRKLPFLAHVAGNWSKGRCTVTEFLQALSVAIERETDDRKALM